MWATIHKPTQQFIGRCGLLPWTIEGREEVEVAYLLDRAYWGQGLATEAARALIDYGFATLGLSRLICLIDPRNQASINVAHRSGLLLEHAGILLDLTGEGEKKPYLLYACTKPSG